MGKVCGEVIPAERSETTSLSIGLWVYWYGEEAKLDYPRIAIGRTSAVDSDIVAGLLYELLYELTNGNWCSLAELQTTTKDLIEKGLVFGVIASIDTNPVGVLMLNECAAIYAGGRFGEITELYVKPEHRSRGIATVLITEAKKIAKERDWKRLEVGAPDQPAWDKSLRFYLREGFEEVGPRLRLPV